MSRILDSLLFFKQDVEKFSDGYGAVTKEDRGWEDGYRNRWSYDKVVRSTHGVNCTGSCGWKVYVKNGIVTWETQVLDYPRTRADLPNHEPRGCARGASASWYLYSGNRIKTPLIRRRLLDLWREARKTMEPVEAWESIVEDPEKTAQYKPFRGKGGFVRGAWDEVNEIIAASNVYTVKQYGPDRVCGFSPIPAMSMISYSAGTRYLSLIGGTCLSFYDWYADLPPASPQTWGEQTDVPESADWYNSSFIMVWGSNVPQTRTPDAHYLAEARYKGTKVVVVTPDYSEASKFADLWLNPKQGTDAALAMAIGHVILKEFHVDKEVPYFKNYCRKYTDMPFLVRLKEQEVTNSAGETTTRWIPERFLRASDFDNKLDETNNPDWKTVALDEKTGGVVVPSGSIGFRWGEDGKWNLEEKTGTSRADTELQLSALREGGETLPVSFPYFAGGDEVAGRKNSDVQERLVPIRELKIGTEKVRVATVYDLMLAHYGVDRELGDDNTAKSFREIAPYTPGWQQSITGISREKIITVAREFAETAARTEGKSMVIIGTGVNHWFHSDMAYRAVSNMLMMCGCIGKSGGGWAHYVGQEKLRPAAGWLTLGFGLDWVRPPRQMNSTSFFYVHTNQWRYEKIDTKDLLSPTVEDGDWDATLMDYNMRSIRMGWLPSSPQLETNPLQLSAAADKAGKSAPDYIAAGFKDGSVKMAWDNPDKSTNYPRMMFVWRSNLLGSSAKGHEYFLKHLVGAKHGVQGDDLKARGERLPTDVEWHDEAPEGKLDLLVTIDFRMSTTCMYSDIVLPTATWYEKNDLSTTDMHPFIHPLTAAVDPVWEAKADFEIFKGFAKGFSEVCQGHLGIEKDIVLTPLMHDTPTELGQALDVQDWKKGECEPIPGKTMPSVTTVERDYPNTYKRFTALGPLASDLGTSVKGISWDAKADVEALKERCGVVEEDGQTQGLPKIETDLNACETILALSPETNGHVAMKSWEALEKKTGREHQHLAAGRESDAIRFEDIVAQPRKVITAPTWSGIESEEVSYSAGHTNVFELIPWRTLTGRQQFYQDHSWMRAFGEGFPLYRPKLNTRAIRPVIDTKDNGEPQLVLNFLTPHQKWGIHSSFTDNQLMLTLSRGGPNVWISEEDAQILKVEDNDWIEVYNVNGALAARAVVSQRVKTGTAMMYHSQDKTVNSPTAETTGTRGIHNSVCRIVVKPTHMIGGYAQLSYGFNYYGTVGANRDDVVIVRKLQKLDFKDGSKVIPANKRPETAL